MSYSNSSLINCTIKSPNHSGQRYHKIDRITPHCVVGQANAEAIGNCFTSRDRKASCNYGIGYDGRVCLVVDEANRSWCSSSAENDNRAVTIEVASDTTAPFAFKEAAYNKLVDLCVDICKRNELNKVLWFSDKNTALSYVPKDGECVLTVHRWFANKSCPGDWMFSRMGQLADDINKKLKSSDTPEETATINATKKATDAATRFDKTLAKTYTTKTTVNVRNGPGINKSIMTSLPANFKVKCYGYYSMDKNNNKWLYVQFIYKGITYTGFMYKNYLV